ncbi:hypothetical protein ACFQ3W_14235 [Paenibacillus puldeungensis]|uniref:Uncharacterized protein n=1 Tax=Paenibacillus puldeungensis TaxID=696536 RepID=A0ABW3RZ67_9BACL
MPRAYARSVMRVAAPRGARGSRFVIARPISMIHISVTSLQTILLHSMLVSYDSVPIAQRLTAFYTTNLLRFYASEEINV